MGSSVGSGSHGSEPWDVPFNRATNRLKGRELELRPTSAGRVSGYGLGMNHGEYYSEDTEVRKARRLSKAAASAKEIESLRAQVAQIPLLQQQVAQIPALQQQMATMQQTVQDNMVTTLTGLFPSLIESIDAWNANGREGPFVMPSMTASNSSNHLARNAQLTPAYLTATSPNKTAAAPPPSITATLPNMTAAAPPPSLTATLPNMTAATPPLSLTATLPNMTAAAPPVEVDLRHTVSTLEELNALTVTKRLIRLSR